MFIHSFPSLQESKQANGSSNEKKIKPSPIDVTNINGSLLSPSGNTTTTSTGAIAAGKSKEVVRRPCNLVGSHGY